MTPKLRGLAGLLMSQPDGGEDQTDQTDDTELIKSIKQAVAEDARILKAAKDAQKAAEDEIAQLREEIVQLREDRENDKKEMTADVKAMLATAHAERDRMMKAHQTENQKNQDLIATLHGQLADEKQARVKAETEAAASNKMCANYEKMMTKLKAPAPQQIVAPAPMREPPTVDAKIKRNDLGEIIGVTYTPRPSKGA